MQRILNITAKDPLYEYLLNLEHYESLYVSSAASKGRFCIPDGFHMSKNLMSYNIGFPTGFLPGKSDMSDDEEFIQEWISYVSRKFHFVIIVEYFHESMVLLKRKMCWDLRDIIYFSQNVGSYGFKTERKQTLIQIYKKWSSVDYRLYDHFNRTLWHDIAEASGDFRDEVDHYERVISDVHRLCESITNGKVDRGTFITVYGTQWNKPFDVTAELCKILGDDLLTRVQRLWDFTHPQMEEPKPDRQYC